MKKIALLSLLLLASAALPAEAQFFRRPIVQQVIASPFVHELVQFGLHQVLPNLPNIPMPPADTTPRDTRIFVDSSVSRNLEATERNLSDTRTLLDGLLTKHGLKTPPKKGSINQKD